MKSVLFESKMNEMKDAVKRNYKLDLKADETGEDYWKDTPNSNTSSPNTPSNSNVSFNQAAQDVVNKQAATAPLKPETKQAVSHVTNAGDAITGLKKLVMSKITDMGNISSDEIVATVEGSVADVKKYSEDIVTKTVDAMERGLPVGPTEDSSVGEGTTPLAKPQEGTEAKPKKSKGWIAKWKAKIFAFVKKAWKYIKVKFKSVVDSIMNYAPGGGIALFMFGLMIMALATMLVGFTGAAPAIEKASASFMNSMKTIFSDIMSGIANLGKSLLNPSTIFSALLNMIIKIIATPFAVIGSLFSALLASGNMLLVILATVVMGLGIAIEIRVYQKAASGDAPTATAKPEVAATPETTEPAPAV